MYRNERGFPFLLPFLAGAIVGPLFVNGIGGWQNNCQGPNCYMYPPPYNTYGPVINPVYGMNQYYGYPM